MRSRISTVPTCHICILPHMYFDVFTGNAAKSLAIYVYIYGKECGKCLKKNLDRHWNSCIKLIHSTFKRSNWFYINSNFLLCALRALMANFTFRITWLVAQPTPQSCTLFLPFMYLAIYVFGILARSNLSYVYSYMASGNCRLILLFFQLILAHRRRPEPCPTVPYRFSGGPRASNITIPHTFGPPEHP